MKIIIPIIPFLIGFVSAKIIFFIIERRKNKSHKIKQPDLLHEDLKK